MSGTDRLDPADEHDVQAAEYVIGALPPNQARALEALALNDATVAASISAWELRLSPLADLVQPVAPPPLLWQRLALATGIESVARDTPRPRPRGVFARPGIWRAGTAVGLALAAGMAFLLIRPVPETQIAALTSYNGPGTIYLVRLETDGTATVLATGNTDVPQGRSLELWAVRPGATAPESMGLLPASGRVRVPLVLPTGTQLLVSQEPQGGSPTKQPTGPVVYKGQLTGI